MCELRPIMWPCYTINEFTRHVQWLHKPHTDWYDGPLHVAGFLLNLAIMLIYWRRFKDDDDDDRWTKRRKRITSKIKSRLTIHQPVPTRV